MTRNLVLAGLLLGVALLGLLGRDARAVTTTTSSTLATQRWLFDDVCASTPCHGPKVRALAGLKTVTVQIDGTGSVDVICRPISAGMNPETFFTATGTDLSNTFSFEEACMELSVDVTACTAGTCHVRSAVYGPQGF